MDCWEKRPRARISQANWDLLQSIYLHPHHIDLIVGGFAETPMDGGVVGPTFGHIIGHQFNVLKFGDRFFFTHKGNMNSQELAQVRQRTLGDIICDNTHIPRIKEDVFRSSSKQRECPARTGMDINKFQVFKAQPTGGR